MEGPVRALRLTHALDRRFVSWNVGLAHAHIHELLCGSVGSTPVSWLPLGPSGTFFADPFGFEENGKLVVLVEAYSEALGRGWIEELTIDPHAQDLVVQRRPAIVEPHHLSYPCLVRDRGLWYCIPEAHETGEVRAYVRTGRGGAWESVGTLLQGVPGVDSTVLHHGGAWWLFCTTRSSPDDGVAPNRDLYIYYSHRLLGPWHRHRAAPVKSDVSSARPAGTPFQYMGELWRPAQDCSSIYGGAVVLMRVVELTPDRFEEEPAARLEANALGEGLSGVHTVSQVGEWTLLDARRSVALDPVNYTRRLARMIRRRINRLLLR